LFFGGFFGGGWCFFEFLFGWFLLWFLGLVFLFGGGGLV